MLSVSLAWQGLGLRCTRDWGRAVVQTDTANEPGWAGLGWGLLRGTIGTAAAQREVCGQAGFKLPSLLVFCTLRAGWPLRARKGLL